MYNNNTQGNNAIRIFFFLGSLASLFPVIYFYLILKWLGFPDGHLTERDRWLEQVYPNYITIGMVFSLVFAYLSWQNKETKIVIAIRWLSLLLFLVFIAVIFGLEHYVGSQLENGTGG